MLFTLWRRWRLSRRRAIYQYWDGSRSRRIDPIQVYLGLQSHPRFNAAVHCKLCDEGDPEAITITTGAVRDVFAIETYDPATGRGLTLGEQLGLLSDYYLWIEEQKKSTSLSQTSPSSTEASTSFTSPSEITPPTSASGPAEGEPTSDTPTPSASP